MLFEPCSSASSLQAQRQRHQAQAGQLEPKMATSELAKPPVRKAPGFHKLPPGLGESLRGNRIGATGLRASERKSASERVSERVSEREGFQRVLRGFERF